MPVIHGVRFPFSTNQIPDWSAPLMRTARNVHYDLHDSRVTVQVPPDTSDCGMAVSLSTGRLHR